MRHATAVRRLRTIAEECDRLGSLLGADGGLVAAFAFGPVLDDPGHDLDVVHLALVMDLPAEALPWGVEPTECTSLANWLRLDKAPVMRRWRPRESPVSNHVIRRPMPIWTREGVDTSALDALAELRGEQFRLADPEEGVRTEQVACELDTSAAYLRAVRDRYWASGPAAKLRSLSGSAHCGIARNGGFQARSRARVGATTGVGAAACCPRGGGSPRMGRPARHALRPWRAAVGRCRGPDRREEAELVRCRRAHALRSRGDQQPPRPINAVRRTTCRIAFHPSTQTEPHRATGRRRPAVTGPPPLTQ